MLYDLFLLLATAYINTFTQLVTTTVLLVNYPIAISYFFLLTVTITISYITLLKEIQLNADQCITIKISYITVTTLKAIHSLILILDCLFSS